MRYVSQHGSSITCTSDRQSIAYTLRCPVSAFAEMKCFLLDTVIRCWFKEWEMEDLKPMIRDDLHRIHPEKRVIDLAQKACWGGPLNNSIYCESSRIDSMTGEILSNYTEWNFKTDHCSRYIFHFIFIRCLLQHAIIAHACGTGNMQDGTHVLDRTPEHPLGLMSGDDVHTTYRAFNLSYYETGIFGILARTRAHTAWDVAKAAAEFLSNVGDLSCDQIEIGKKRLKVSLAIHDDDCVRMAEGLALQVASGYQIDSAKNSMTMIDEISKYEIANTARCLSCKYQDMAIAVVGDIGRVPHNRELVCGL
ncbi:hypothetical protein HF086_008438 [Spodoptera exigua]|uniref:Peptidase M16 N-terminal domain-containing protein n=1 Tax=Spodoptera exigua TaxID=7107 RepID=A0A922SIZ2_SPOEX|nr:hypothetical protein HF086_008438 [Spodoptera exigua]